MEVKDILRNLREKNNLTQGEVSYEGIHFFLVLSAGSKHQRHCREGEEDMFHEYVNV